MQFRPWRLPDDLPRIAAIAGASFWSPVTAADLEAREKEPPIETIRHRLVAVSPEGLVVAYGQIGREEHTVEGRFFVRVAVAPEHRHQGIGTALLARLEGWARERGATSFETKFRDEPAWLAFARRNGYTQIQGHHIGFLLDLPRFDETPFTDRVPRLEAEGLRFTTLAAVDSPAMRRAVHELERHCNADEPGFENEPFVSFENWEREICESAAVPRDCIILALDGERPVALTTIGFAGLQRDLMRVYFTGVHREYRGRGLALAVKLLAIQTARRYGAARLGTGTDERNGAMAHLNRKLGFGSQPGMYWCIKA
ncbi:MAG: GNAT family N-acetyltransferase [Bacillota bacterium]